jgi:predicted nicotinamide N-methyase
MAVRSPSELRAFVRAHTTLEPLAELPDVRLHVAADVMETCRLAGIELGQADPPLPYWAFPWAGGLAVARYLRDQPSEVAGKSVLDLATGSGLCAIVAALAGAREVEAVDIDPLSVAAAKLNARANRVAITVRRGDRLDDPPPDVEVVLAGDVCYEETMSRRMIEWLRTAAGAGARVLIGDPGRAYLPDGLRRIATYDIRTSLEIEDSDHKPAGVYTIGALRPD